MNTVLLLIILVPVLEIYLFIKIGSQIGAFTTISLIFVTAIIGVYYARYEGLNTLRSGVSQLYKNQMPLFELMSGAALAVAAFLLILPGFATDLLGFLIIFPLTRKIIFSLLAKRNKTEEELKSGKFNKFGIYLETILDFIPTFALPKTAEDVSVTNFILEKRKISTMKTHQQTSSRQLRSHSLFSLGNVGTLIKLTSVSKTSSILDSIFLS